MDRKAWGFVMDSIRAIYDTTEAMAAAITINPNDIGRSIGQLPSSRAISIRAKPGHFIVTRSELLGDPFWADAEVRGSTIVAKPF